MPPCNVNVQELNDTAVEVAAIDYEASMIAFENPELKGVTAEIKKRLEKVINNI
jgi:uncharacterized protein (DUF302 family)